ncbi:MAG: radical SAM protein [Candidatus Bathyarchaeota archaeon]|nr:MAG: radical SAM protein [Candidatus Bathyarchaeota archaeon]
MLAYRLLKGLIKTSKTECKICGKTSKLTADCLRICVDCLRERPKEALPYVRETHARIRARFELPPLPPKRKDGVLCNVCANECRLGEQDTSYCGFKRIIDGRLESLISSESGVLHSYLDSQVTNCCAAWFCPAGTATGYPTYTYTPGPEYGYSNLAIFFYGCNFDCLFCQNASHKNLSAEKRVTAEDLIATTRRDPRISCWCFFGGSPEPQLPFAIRASQAVLKEMSNRILRICFEWNGCGNPKLVSQAADIALQSGGTTKFDLKCFTPSISHALSGVPNQRAFENFKMIARDIYPLRPDLPVLTATTLLVPTYVDAREVEQIAQFIANLDPEIPYSLLVFHPDFMMADLPITPLKQVIECYKMAKKHLTKVHIGNLHSLGIRNMKEFKTKIRKE